MKASNKLLIAVLFIFSSAFVNNINAQEDGLKPLAEFETTTFQFGKIKQNVPAKAVFKVTNSSMVPLIISNVKPTCGCTVANYPKEPIKPGESAEIVATYNARNLGSFTKSVYVTTNADETKITLYMKGEVITVEAFENLESKE